MKTVGVVGLGRIGAGWCAWFLARGYKVKAFDNLSERDAILERIHEAWKLIERRGFVLQDASVERYLTLCSSIAEVVADVDVLQECVLEDLSVKTECIRELDSLASPGVWIASSTSFIPLDLLTSGCRYPERIAVAHPLQPQFSTFVEICSSSSDSMSALQSFYEESGMSVVSLLKQVPGHAANTILNSLMYTVVSLMGQKVASIGDLDKAFCFLIGKPVSTVCLEIGNGSSDGFVRLVCQIHANKLPIGTCALSSRILGAKLGYMLNSNVLLPITKKFATMLQPLIEWLVRKRIKPLLQHMDAVAAENYRDLADTVDFRESERQVLHFVALIQRAAERGGARSKL